MNTISNDQAQLTGWIAGFEAANASIDASPTPTRELVLSKLGLTACNDGLCGGICTHAYDAIERRYKLPYGGRFGFEDGVVESLAANAPLLLGEQNV